MNGKGVTDRCATWFLDSTSLKKLAMFDTSITDQFFAKAPNLKNIDLRLEGTNVSGDLQNEIRELGVERRKKEQVKNSASAASTAPYVIKIPEGNSGPKPLPRLISKFFAFCAFLWAILEIRKRKLATS